MTELTLRQFGLDLAEPGTNPTESELSPYYPGEAGITLSSSTAWSAPAFI